MRLSEQSLSLFKELYIQEFGTSEELTNEDFGRLARQTLNLYKSIYGTSCPVIESETLLIGTEE